MDIIGKIIEVLPLQSGEGKNGPWKKQDFVIETASQYPKKICISMWGDKINENIIKEGNEVNAFFDIESREYNGRWYTDVKAWKLEPTEGSEENSSSAPIESNPIPESLEGEDDLPF